MSENISYKLRFNRKDGQPDEEEYFDDLYKSMERFNEMNCPDDLELSKKYYCITLVEVDWYKRAEYILDGVEFEVVN